MEITKGQTTSLDHTIYSKWIAANLAGATINVHFKQRLTDPDSAIVLTKAGAVTDAVNGLATTTLLASNTNNWSYSKLFMETVVVLADGVTIIRQIEEVDLLPLLKKS